MLIAEGKLRVELSNNEWIIYVGNKNIGDTLVGLINNDMLDEETDIEMIIKPKEP